MDPPGQAVSSNRGVSVSALFKLSRQIWSLTRDAILTTSWAVLNPFIVSRRTGSSKDAGTVILSSLLTQNSLTCTLKTQRFTYPSVRLVHKSHPKANKLPNDLPLLVFVHGLGGSAAQFIPLVTSLSSAASCLLIDLPGCGQSTLQPTDEAAYTLPALAELVAVAIQRVAIPGQKAVLVAHSLGCSISALLASQTSQLKHLLLEDNIVAGFVAICPRVEPIPASQRKQLTRVKYVPPLLFDAFRVFDRRGGLNSSSITRFVGKDADIETRKLQARFNSESRSATVLKFLGALSKPESEWPSESIWKGIEVPLFLIAAEGDSVLSPKAIDTVVEWLEDVHKNAKSSASQEGNAIPIAAGDAEAEVERFMTGHTSWIEPQPGPDVAAVKTTDYEHETRHHSHAIKTTMFPASAGHGLMYTTSTVRPLASLIQNFLASHIDARLSPAWQLNHMSTSGKWDVKNLKKWESVEPISGVIANTFRAMKTMREIDEVHTPKRFVKAYGCWSEDGKFNAEGVGIVIDISHEAPVYDPKGLEEGGVHYYKFPTISKLPPSPDEVAAFMSLIDKVRASDENVKQGAKIGIHCHYGFNRTGFFLICYMIEKLGWSVQDALADFKQQRPPGIKHDYFVDELHLRYAVSLQRRGTIVG